MNRPLGSPLTSACPGSSISYASYPHIVEDVVFHADHATKLAFRSTCTTLRDHADLVMCGSTLSLPEGESGCHRLPFFYPDSGRTQAGRSKQHRAINSARLILLDSTEATAELNEALSHIHPQSRAVLNHETGSTVTFRLPALAELTILGSHQCCCNDEEVAASLVGPINVHANPTLLGHQRELEPRHRFAHGAHSVHIDLSLRPTTGPSHHFRCMLTQCALTPDVSRLAITVTEVFHLGMVLAPLQEKLNPRLRHEDFRIEVRFRGARPEFDVQALLAGLLELDAERVAVEDV